MLSGCASESLARTCRIQSLGELSLKACSKALATGRTRAELTTVAARRLGRVVAPSAVRPSGSSVAEGAAATSRWRQSNADACQRVPIDTELSIRANIARFERAVRRSASRADSNLLLAKRREKPTNELECRRLFLAAYPHSSRSPPPFCSFLASPRLLIFSSSLALSLAHILHFKFKLSLVRLNSPNTIKMTKATRANRNKRLNLVALFVD